MLQIQGKICFKVNTHFFFIEVYKKKKKKKRLYLMKFALIRISTTIKKKKKKKLLKKSIKTKQKTHTSSTIEILLHTKCFSGFRQYLI